MNKTDRSPITQQWLDKVAGGWTKTSAAAAAITFFVGAVAIVSNVGDWVLHLALIVLGVVFAILTIVWLRVWRNWKENSSLTKG